MQRAGAVLGLLFLAFGPGAPLTRAASTGAPVNDAFNRAVPLVGIMVETNGSNAGATREPGEPMHAGDAGGRSVWWRWVAPISGSVIVRTTGSGFDTLLGVYTGAAVNALTLVAANDQDLTDPLGGDTSRVKFDAVEETEYRIAVDGYAGASGSIVLIVETPRRPENDRFVDRARLAGTAMAVAGSNWEATRELGEPWHSGDAGGHSVWWSWRAPSSGVVEIATLGSDFDTVLAVYIGDVVDDLIAVAANDQDPHGGDTSRVGFQVLAGVEYQIAVDGWNGESGEIRLQIGLSPPPPILAQPRMTAAGRLQIDILSRPAQTAVLEATADLAAGSWVPIATNLAGAGGAVAFEVEPVASRRFFRARWQMIPAR